MTEPKFSIELRDIAFGWPGTKMLFDLAVRQGSFTAVTGPSGSGKSTLLNLIAGFETAHSGSILLEGKNVTKQAIRDRPVSFLFQDNNLFEHLNVTTNIRLGVGPRFRMSVAEKQRIANAIERVGLSGKEKRLPSELSGGERQRVAFARVLVQNCPILLLDEPFASLGPGLRQDMTALLSQLQRERQMTVLAVTHHPQEWRELADDLIFVENGRVAVSGKASEMLGPNAPDPIRNYLGDTKS
jgi:thiamine transport system ATP-binding protein